MKQEKRNLKKHKFSVNVSHPTLISRQNTVSNDSIDSNYSRTEVNQNKANLLLMIIWSIHKHTTICNQYHLQNLLKIALQQALGLGDIKLYS
jgi:hypothetical protein